MSVARKMRIGGLLIAAWCLLSGHCCSGAFCNLRSCPSLGDFGFWSGGSSSRAPAARPRDEDEETLRKLDVTFEKIHHGQSLTEDEQEFLRNRYEKRHSQP